MESLIAMGLSGGLMIAGLLMRFLSKSRPTRTTGLGLAVAGIALATWYVIGVAFY